MINNFGKEISKVLPILIRECASRQMDIMAKGSITLPQMVILDYLREKNICRMGDLARVLNLTMGAVTVIVDKMIKDNLALRERSESDRRVVNVKLLKKGRNIADKIMVARMKTTNDIFANLTGKEKAEYLRILRKVTAGLNG